MVAGFGTPASGKDVSLVVNGKAIATRKVNVPANGRATAEFAPLDVGYGFNRCEVRIEGGDALPCRRRERLRHTPVRPRARALRPCRKRYAVGAVLRRCAWRDRRKLHSCCNPSPRSRPRTSIHRNSPLSCCPTQSRCPRSSSTRLRNMSRRAAASSSRLAPMRGNTHAFRCGEAMSKDVHDYARTGGAATVGQVDFTLSCA